jgi:hypothetical protein
MSSREARLIMSVISLLSLVWSLGSHVPRTKAWVVRYGRAGRVCFCTVGPDHVGFVLVFFIGGSEKTKHGSRLVDIGGLDGTDRFTTSSFSLQLSICHCYRASLLYNNDLITRTVLGFWECEVISVTQANALCSIGNVLCAGNPQVGDDFEVGKYKDRLELAYVSYPTITQSVRGPLS